jgi:Natural resistance-associated macrophage protein
MTPMSPRFWWWMCRGGKVVVDTLVPSFSWQKNYIVSIVAVLGTTISPYLFFWQASEEDEHEHEKPGAETLILAPEQAPAEIHRIRLDTYVGMAFSNLIALSPCGSIGHGCLWSSAAVRILARWHNPDLLERVAISVLMSH